MIAVIVSAVQDHPDKKKNKKKKERKNIRPTNCSLPDIYF